MKLKHLLFTGALLSAGIGFSQDKNYVEGDLLIQVSSNDEVHTIEEQFQEIGLSKGKLISKHMNIWQFHYSNTEISIDKAIELMYKNNYVVTAQRNHIIKHRATPNDSQFNQQWQYSQPNDKDIDAVEAWDETTGGLTSTGDTIVVCVIDDGVRMTHPDLAPNLWKNYNEIPGNNIDDDGNGYVDDVDGWDAYLSSGDPSHKVPWEGHGSAVAGIVGAKGNNGQGVAGVNWDVKLMMVRGGGEESQAIAAYDYALSNRKLYNSTNGQKGAFVVATNASWGVDGGQASQAPLWCAFYDTLGRYGVLNAGATANVNTNVDTDGDLPTQCPSNYLIAVTNTDNTDTKVNDAGYGANSIDLGAPGADAYTVAQFGNGYGGFGGTSGATPHVAGTIALLYSINCNNFANLAKTEPATAAIKVKEFILNNVDANTSLNGITTTGGRLNVNEAVLAMKNDCPNLAGIEEEVAISNASIYPNPISGNEIGIQFESLTSDKLTISIFDVSGKLIAQQTANANIGSNKIVIPAQNLAQGLYQVKIQTSNGEVNLKVMK